MLVEESHITIIGTHFLHVHFYEQQFVALNVALNVTYVFINNRFVNDE